MNAKENDWLESVADAEENASVGAVSAPPVGSPEFRQRYPLLDSPRPSGIAIPWAIQFALLVSCSAISVVVVQLSESLFASIAATLMNAFLIALLSKYLVKYLFSR